VDRLRRRVAECGAKRAQRDDAIARDRPVLTAAARIVTDIDAR
jgi:hypothetical protein